MSKQPKFKTGSMLNPTSRMAFAVAVCAFLSAGVVIAVNQWVESWMAVGGMVGIGCFYMVIGLLNLRNSTSFIDHNMTTVSVRHARAENLLGEAIICDQVDHTPEQNSFAHPKTENEQRFVLKAKSTNRLNRDV